VGGLVGFFGEGFVVVLAGGFGVEAEVELVFPAEQRVVHRLVAYSPVEALVEAALLGLAGRDVMPVDGGVVCPRQGRTFRLDLWRRSTPM